LVYALVEDVARYAEALPQILEELNG